MSADTPRPRSASKPAPGSRRRTRGAVDVLASGRWRARFTTPDERRLSATLETKREADAWLAAHTADIGRGTWVDPHRGRHLSLPTRLNGSPSVTI